MSINRSDILEDTGMAISPEVDIGQVEGGFIMGLGFWTSEKVKGPRQWFSLDLFKVEVQSNLWTAGRQLHVALQGPYMLGCSCRAQDGVL